MIFNYFLSISFGGLLLFGTFIRVTNAICTVYSTVYRTVYNKVYCKLFSTVKSKVVGTI